MNSGTVKMGCVGSPDAHGTFAIAATLTNRVVGYFLYTLVMMILGDDRDGCEVM